MVTALLGIFASTGFGALIGAVGGLVNRFLDMKQRALELMDKKDERAHELLMRDKDLAIMQAEIKGTLDIKSIEAVTESEKAGYAAMEASYDNDKATYGDKWVDRARGFMRPAITFVFLCIIVYVNYRVWEVMDTEGVKLSTDQLFEIIRWTLFEASVVIGWWFAMRPSGNAGLSLPKR